MFKSFQIPVICIILHYLSVIVYVTESIRGYMGRVKRQIHLRESRLGYSGKGIIFLEQAYL